MKQQYVKKRFFGESLAQIDRINSILDSYQSQGFVLTVRQLYYQLVARGYIPNTEKSYQNTAALINNARLAGLVDWDMIEDRTRSFVDRPHWQDGKQFLDNVGPQFFVDLWEGQPTRVYAIVEKEALSGVLSKVCRKYDIPLLAARGYPSASVLREFAVERILPTVRKQKQNVLILHLGDHDPSGIDMTRDLEERLFLLSYRTQFELRRVALTMDQVEEVNPPPNPAKVTDARFNSYQELYGDESWELDALEPAYIENLIKQAAEQVIKKKIWNERLKLVDTTKTRLAELSKKWK